MYPLLDHDDFSKSRKALLATSALLLLLSHLQILGESATVSGLTFKIDRTVFTGFGCIFLIYFSYAFIVRAFELYFSKRISAIQESMKELLGELREIDISSIQVGDRAEMETRLRDAMTDIQRTSEKLQSFVMVGLEIVPPLLLAGYTAYKVGAADAAIQFLRL